MADFDKLIGAGGEQTNQAFLRREVARLTAANADLSQELTLRAMPTLSELIDALDNLIRGAEGGNAAAKAMLQKFEKSMARARELVSPIEVVRG